MLNRENHRVDGTEAGHSRSQSNVSAGNDSKMSDGKIYQQTQVQAREASLVTGIPNQHFRGIQQFFN